MSLSNREKILLFGTLVVLIAAAYIWFFYLPLSQQIAAVDEQNQSLRADIESMKEVPAVAAPDSATAQETLQVMEASFPLQPDQVEVIDVLNKAAAETGLMLKSAHNSEKVAGKGEQTGKINFDVSTRGGFHDSMDFLQRLEENLRVSSVENIVLSTVKKKEQPTSAQVTVSEGAEESSQPVYFLQPLLAPAPKSEAVKQPETAAAAPVAESSARQADNLDVGQVDMQMQVVFYYYNGEKETEADKNKPSGAVNT